MKAGSRFTMCELLPLTGYAIHFSMEFRETLVKQSGVIF